MEKCRWGIMGCASIARKNVRAIALSSNSILTAVASRSLDKAAAFCRDNKLSDVAVFGSYEELLTCDNVDAVYLPLPTTQHLHWALRTAAAGKHILLEKPAALHSTDLQTILEACADAGVLFMDGVMFIHHTRMQQLFQTLNDPFVGSIHRIHSSFSFFGSQDFLQNDIRTSAEGDPLGCLGDLGWYCIYLAIAAFNSTASALTKLPTSAAATCHQWQRSANNSKSVPVDVTAIVWFGTSSSLVFDCSFTMPFRQRYEISCMPATSSTTPKVITCDDFVIPKNDSNVSFTVTSAATSDVDTRVISNDSLITSPSCCQEAAMFTDFSAAVLGASASDLSRYVNFTVAVQATIDACYKSLQEGGTPVEVKYQ